MSKRNFIVLERNYCRWGGEIDIVAIKNKIVHLIEVKTIIGNSEYKPEFNISEKKIRTLRKTAFEFLRESREDPKRKKLDFVRIVFDILAIKITEGKIRIKFLENAF